MREFLMERSLEHVRLADINRRYWVFRVLYSVKRRSFPIVSYLTHERPMQAFYKMKARCGAEIGLERTFQMHFSRSNPLFELFKPLPASVGHEPSAFDEQEGADGVLA